MRLLRKLLRSVPAANLNAARGGSTVDLTDGAHKRVSTLTAGMTFGEIAMLTGGTRSAIVRADTAIDCLSLDVADFAHIESERPLLANRLLRNLLESMARTTMQRTAEVSALEG